jgi:hypothetical protein
MPRMRLAYIDRRERQPLFRELAAVGVALGSVCCTRVAAYEYDFWIDDVRLVGS